MRLRVFLVILIGMLFGCRASESEPDAMIFMAGYRPQANLPFVGVYVAQEKGYFAAEHLTVDIQHSVGHGQHLQLLASGKVAVTTQDAAVLLKRRANPGLPLVSLALIGQKGQQAFVALADSGLETVADWRGHTIGYKGTPSPDVLALLHTAGLSEDDVQWVNVGFDPRVLAEGLVDVYPVFNSNEPYLLRKWGYEIREWSAAGVGLPSMGLVYVTTESEIAQRPERLARFMRAALRGIAYASQHPDEAVDIVMKYAGPETDREHMRFMLDTELRDAKSPLTKEYGMGWQTAAQWQALEDELWHYHALAAPVDVTQVFTTQFLSP